MSSVATSAPFMRSVPTPRRAPERAVRELEAVGARRVQASVVRTAHLALPAVVEEVQRAIARVQRHAGDRIAEREHDAVIRLRRYVNSQVIR